MNNLLKSNQFMLPIMAVLFFSALASPLASVRSDVHAPATCVLESCETKKTGPCTKSTARPEQKSVLDAEALESPITFFKDMMSTDSEEEDRSATSPAGPVLIAVKGLVATLLSTII
ncbi:hypothetical protein ACMA1I_21180 [Pontibacter sp. 13R65]|uniref:hypothetical protein n=1 Tax=Pontibacter sp. 13R65 TaxID=3127458 RepID=UPI00301D5944